jgi:hypothetical protein
MTTLTAIAALIAGISIASAQNMGGSAAPGGSPSNINKGSINSTQSGSENSGTAMQSGGQMNTNKHFTGNGKFCLETAAGGSLQCNYASLAACQKDGKPNNRQCAPNPKMGTTGSK